MTPVLLPLLLSAVPPAPVERPAPLLPLLDAPAPAISAPVVAAPDERPPLEYTYVELNYLWTDFDGAGDPIDGAELTGSLELPLNWFVQGSVARQTGDFDLDSYRIGAGWHLGVTNLLDVYGMLSYVDWEVDSSGNNGSEDGLAAEAGARLLPLRGVEVNGALLWRDIDESDSGVALGARYYLSEMISVGARFEFYDNADSVAAGVRLEF